MIGDRRTGAARDQIRCRGNRSHRQSQRRRGGRVVDLQSNNKSPRGA